MKVNKFIFSCLSLSLFLYGTSPGASSDFQQWLQQQTHGVQSQKDEFQAYKDKRDKEFTLFLKSQWKAVDLVEGVARDKEPKPDVLPVAPVQPVTQIPRPEIQSVQPPEVKPAVIVIPKPVVIAKPVPAPTVVKPKGKSIGVDFYGKQLHFIYDGRLKQGIRSRINKETVSNYWSTLSQADYDDLLKQLASQKQSLQLNDWAFASLVNKLAAAINRNKKNETALLSWFVLAKSGYKARIAYNDASVYLLVPSKHEMFEVSYFTFGGKRYYAIAFDGRKQKLGQVYTYDGEYPGTTKDFDMQVSSVVASADSAERRLLSFNFDGTQYDIEVMYDRGRVLFFSTYPQLNLALYFSSGVNEETATPLQKQLAKNMQGMSEQQAVNFLLRFVQTSLKYETDDRQFGEENYLFPEETLYYPYSDCEDRAVLFAWLVKSLLDLDVVGLDYPGHVAAAVNFNETVTGDSVNYQGKRYVVTDPTYINARAGMTMPNFKQFKPTVIAY